MNSGKWSGINLNTYHRLALLRRLGEGCGHEEEFLSSCWIFGSWQEVALMAGLVLFAAAVPVVASAVAAVSFLRLLLVG